MADTSAQSSGAAGPDAPDPKHDRFGRVLGFVWLSMIAVALVPSDNLGRAFLLLVPSATLLVTMHATYRSGRAIALTGVVLVILNVAAVATALRAPDEIARSAPLILSLIVSAFVPVLIARRVTAHPAVSVQTVLGGISIYVQIGVLFALVYASIQSVTQTPFFSASRPITQSDFVYYSIATLTTVGYGDLTAAAPLGRMLSVTESLFGQIYLVTVVALIVSRFREAKPGGRVAG